MTTNEFKQIFQYLDMLIESDRGLKPEAARDLLIEAFALTPDEARSAYRDWLKDV